MRFMMLILLLGPVSVALGAYRTISIQEALRMHCLDASFSYVAAPKHRNVQTVLTNTGKEPLCVEVMPGMRLNNENPECQDFLVIQYDTVRIMPGKSRQVKLTAMCCERGDRAPYQNSRFFSGQNPRTDLVRLCRIADSLNLSGYETQTAIWSLADRRGPNGIIGESYDMVMFLRHYVGSVLQMKVLDYQTGNYVRRVSSLPSQAFHQDGVLRLDSLNSHDQVALELYNADSDEWMGGISHERMLIQGRTLNLFLNNIQLRGLQSDSRYIVRLMKNGVVYREWLYVTA
jgi:hypothetical protein